MLGWSGGGPHALACGYRFPERLTAVGVVTGFAPFDRPSATDGMRKDMRRFLPLMRTFPWLANVFVSPLPGEYRRDPARAFEKQFGRDLPECDRRALADEQVRGNLLAGAVEAVRQGSKGLGNDVQLFMARPWGFSPSSLRVPIHLWYGESDTLTPPQMGHYLAQSIPQSHLTVYPNEGHMIFYTHWSDILTTLRSAS